MPIREYQCEYCNRTEERIELESELTPYPKCWCRAESHGNVTIMQPIVSVPAPAQFKGSGFHKTDYPNK